MTPLEQRILQARNHQLVARIMRDRTLEGAATKLMDVALDHWARQQRFRLVDPVEFTAPTPN